jgi:hypothetical protein
MADTVNDTDTPMRPLEATATGGVLGALGGLWLAQFTPIAARDSRDIVVRAAAVTVGAALAGAAAVLLLTRLPVARNAPQAERACEPEWTAREAARSGAQQERGAASAASALR